MVHNTVIKASAFALGLMASMVAGAQPASVNNTGAPETYRSAFEGYQVFSNDKVANWKDANDTVGEIGGWRVYAQEARGDERKAPDQAPQQGQQRPPAGGSAAPAAGHGKH